ncbi:hypothetical protein niasHT_023225 [Heterodera trifolii]|uniref:Uncharacterized protein n=1 Tax=Heterodera trifolii TaxID=157864 RepID=A0ABD2JDF1_9BILA
MTKTTDFDDLCYEHEDEYEFRRDRATEIPLPTSQNRRRKGFAVREAYHGTNDATRNDMLSFRFDGGDGGTSTAPQTTEEPKDKQTQQNEDKHAEPKHTLTRARSASLPSHRGTFQYAGLVEPHNKSMLLSELDGLSRERDAHSAFNVPKLEAAIYSAHDIKACCEANLASAAAAETDGEEFQPKNTVEVKIVIALIPPRILTLFCRNSCSTMRSGLATRPCGCCRAVVPSVVDEADRMQDTARMEWLGFVEKYANVPSVCTLNVSSLTDNSYNNWLQRILVSATLSMDVHSFHKWNLLSRFVEKMNNPNFTNRKTQKQRPNLF